MCKNRRAVIRAKRSVLEVSRAWHTQASNALVAWLLRPIISEHRSGLTNKEEAMLSDLISYGVLASIFIVTGLRVFVDKPNKLREIPLPRWRRVTVEKNFKPTSRDA